MKLVGNNWVAVGPALPNQLVSFAVDSQGVPYILYNRQSVSNQLAVVKLATTNVWQPVGDLSGYMANTNYNDAVLKLSSTDIPYLVFPEINANSQKVMVGAVVLKFINGQWAAVGNPYFSGGNGFGLFGLCLAFDPENNPYVGFGYTFPYGQVAQVMTLN